MGMSRRKRRIIVFTHDILGDPFWDEFRHGLKEAEARFGIEVLHCRVDRFTPGAMRALMVDALRAHDHDAILSTIPDPHEVEEPLRSAISLGVPVFAVNARDPRPETSRIRYRLFVGADDELGGRLAAHALLDRCACRFALIVDHYRWKQTCHSDRIAGIRSVLDGRRARHETLEIDGTDRERAIAQVLAALEQKPEIDGVLTLGPPGASAVLGAMRAAGRSKLANHVTFDLSGEQREAMFDRRIAAAMDCQQYLQALLGVTVAAIYLRTGFLPTTDVLTGPVVVDRTALLAKRALRSELRPASERARARAVP
jgi:simple sugar transport system substrate-binding protein